MSIHGPLLTIHDAVAMPSLARRALVLAAAVVVLGVTTFLAAPYWLTPEDPLERCAALVVLNGDQPVRADEAARLYQAASAPEVWLTSDPRNRGRGGESDAGTVSNMRRLLRHGVPRAAIRELPGAAIGTRAELAIVLAEAQRYRAGCVIVVTSPLHARRVKLTWRHEAGGATRLVVRHAPDAGYTGWTYEAQELVLSGRALLGFPR